MDIRKGVVISRTNLIDSKKEATLPWKGMGLIVLITLALWGGAFLYRDYVQRKTETLQQQLTSAKSGRDYAKIALVADSQSRLNSINAALAERIDWNLFFKKLEENTIPEVTFTNLEARNPGDNNGGGALAGTAGAKNAEYLVTLKGTTIGLNNLAKQITVFEGMKNDKTDPLFQNIRIEKTDMKKTEAGQAGAAKALDFIIDATINPSIYQNNSNNNSATNSVLSNP